MAQIILSLFGALITFIELVMQLSNKSLCTTTGCQLAAESIKYGGWTILLTGFLAFSILAFLTFFERKKYFFHVTAVINSLIILSLAIEGFFTGYQVFRLHNFCIFCLTVFTIFCLLAIIRLFSGQKQIILGFCCFFCIFFMFALLKSQVQTKNVCLPQDRSLILFYSKRCPHCKKVIKECKKCNVDVCKLPAEQYINILRSLDINEVPVLVVNEKTRKEFLIGENQIKKYLKVSSNDYNNKNLSFPSFFTNNKQESGFCSIGKSCQ